MVIWTFKFTIFFFSLLPFIFLSWTKNKYIITPMIIPTTAEYIYLIIDLWKNPKSGSFPLLGDCIPFSHSSIVCSTDLALELAMSSMRVIFWDCQYFVRFRGAFWQLIDLIDKYSIFPSKGEALKIYEFCLYLNIIVLIENNKERWRIIRT